MKVKTTTQLPASGETNLYVREQLATLDDLNQFGNDLLKEIKYLLSQKQVTPEKQWLKSYEVRKLLKISPGTLQHLRDTGQLPFTKLGGLIYFEYEAIRRMIENR